MSWFCYRGGGHQRQRDWNRPLAPPGEAERQLLVDWEQGCRGYQLFEYPVPLEPAFSTPLNSVGCHVLPDTSSPQSLQFFQLLTPTEQKLTVPAVDGWLRSLSCLRSPLSFELTADSGTILYQLAMQSGDVQNITLQLPVHFPKCELYAGGDYLSQAIQSLQHQPLAYSTVEFGLSHFSFFSLRRFAQLTTDPMASVLATLGHLESGEVAGVQIRLIPVREAWGEALLSVAAQLGGDELVRSKTSHAKMGQMLFACGLRVFALSTYGYGRAFSLCQSLGQAVNVLDEPGQNGLLALSPECLGEEVLMHDVLERKSHRPGFLLGLEEVRGLAHPPSETIQHPKLLRSLKAEETLSPELLQGPGALLGRIAATPDGLNALQAGSPIFWPDTYRTHHAYILGATRMGKSTLLLNLMTQELQSGHGFCLIDPHGDLAQDVLQRVPEHRQQDVLYVDLSDREFPLALGLLEARDEWEERLVCSDILSILRRLFASSWGDRLEHILRHVLLTLLSQPACKQRSDGDIYGDASTRLSDGHNVTSLHRYLSSRRPTLRDIRPLLSHKGYREALLRNIHDPDLLAFWQGEFPAYSSSTFAPIYNKLGLLLSSGLVRNIVAQSRSKLSFPQLIQNKKVILVNLSAGLIGEDNAHFLGALLVSKLQIAAMQSLRYEREQRTPFTLYVDEFQHFVVSSFEKILSEAGKAGLSLVMANQFLEQLPSSLQSAIVGNVGTIASFRVSSESGRLLEKELAGKVTAERFVSLQRGEAVVRIGSARDTALIHTSPPPTAEKSVGIGEIVEATRTEVCRSRTDIEAELAQERNLWEQLFQADVEAKNRSKPKAKSEPKTQDDSVVQEQAISETETFSEPEPIPGRDFVLRKQTPKTANQDSESSTSKGHDRAANKISAMQKELAEGQKSDSPHPRPEPYPSLKTEQNQTPGASKSAPTAEAKSAPLDEPESFGWIEEESVEDTPAALQPTKDKEGSI